MTEGETAGRATAVLALWAASCGPPWLGDLSDSGICCPPGMSSPHRMTCLQSGQTRAGGVGGGALDAVDAGGSASQREMQAS